MRGFPFFSVYFINVLNSVMLHKELQIHKITPSSQKLNHQTFPDTSLFFSERWKNEYIHYCPPHNFLLVPFKTKQNKLQFNEKLKNTSVPTVGSHHMSFLSSQLNRQPPETLTNISPLMILRFHSSTHSADTHTH